MTEGRAKTMARNIRDYWARKGYAVRVEVYRERWVKGVAGGPSYGVKTNLKNGMPPDFKGDKAEFRP